MDDEIEIPIWNKIIPEIIGSNYYRYQTVKKIAPGKLLVYVKMPCSGMEGCDACAGPHRKKNKKCSKTLRRRPYIDSPPNNFGGIKLFDIYSGLPFMGIWIMEMVLEKTNRRSAVAILYKKS